MYIKNIQRSFRKLFLCVSAVTILVMVNLVFLQSKIKYWSGRNFLYTSLDTYWKNIARLREGPMKAEDPWLISYLRSHYLIPPAHGAYNLRIDSNLHHVWLQNHIGTALFKFIEETFKDSPPGFFVEAGALDGEIYSNTLWLEVKKNWTGLLIEPNPFNCLSLVKKHRKAFFSCSCISPHKYAKETVLEIPHTSSNVEIWMFRHNARSVESRFHTIEDGISQVSSYSYSPVQCFPLASYLFAINVTTVDLLSLDTQGGERSMLRNFPFDKIKVKYIISEYYRRGEDPTAKDNEFVDIMSSNGFKLLQYDRQNYFFSSV